MHQANRGALRLEQQLTGQNILVPQGGDVFLANGQIDSLRTGSGGHCECELQLDGDCAAAGSQPDGDRRRSEEES